MLYKQIKPFYRYIKRHFTILESIIALFLLSGLLIILFGFFGELSVYNIQTKKTIEESFKKQYVESRLSFIFSHITNENDTKRIFYFYSLVDEFSTFPSIIFTFNNEVVLNPRISGDVVGRLFVNSHRQLCLAIWPILKLKSQTKEEVLSHQNVEVLLDNVENIQFSFLPAPETNSGALEEVKNDPPKGQWLTQWEKDYEQMPVIVRILVQQKNDPNSKPYNEEFSFVLPSSKNPIKFVAK